MDLGLVLRRPIETARLIRSWQNTAGQIGSEDKVRVADRSPGTAGSGESRIDCAASDFCTKREASEERFLSAQADPFTGVKGEEKVGLLRPPKKVTRRAGAKKQQIPRCARDDSGVGRQEQCLRG